MSRGPVLDRPLQPEWLDAALEMARSGQGPDRMRGAMLAHLEAFPMGKTARTKTVTSVARIWFTPPPYARPLVTWATTQDPPADLRVLHWGAILGTNRFFSDICASVGRALQHEETVLTPDIRARMRRTWGDRRTISNATQRAIKTLRAFGALTGQPSSSESRGGTPLVVEPRWVPWLTHALMLGRGVTEIDERDTLTAPELFMLNYHSVNYAAAKYPHLEQHIEGGGRSVLALRVGVSGSP